MHASRCGASWREGFTSRMARTKAVLVDEHREQGQRRTALEGAATEGMGCFRAVMQEAWRQEKQKSQQMA